MTSNLKVVHESEMQRQHVRVEIPGSVKVGDKTYKIKDLSAGGVSIHAAEKIPALANGRIKILFPFGSYALQLALNAQLVDEGQGGFARLRFTDLEESQISLINHIVHARMSGLVVTEGDIMNVVSRNNFGKPRQKQAEKQTRAARLRRILPTVFMSLAGLAALVFVAGNIYEGLSVLKSYQGVVESEAVTVRTHIDGRVKLLVSPVAEKVSKNQPLVVMEKSTAAAGASAAGAPVAPENEITIYSPCDCSILKVEARNGEFRAVGESLFELSPPEARPWVSVLVDPKEARRLRLQDDVNLKIAGEGGLIAGQIIDMSVERLELPYTKVRIRPEASLSLDMIGRPVYAEFLDMLRLN